MPILYSTVARGTTVLACQASCRGNFSEVVEQVLMKISPENAKLTYSHENYLFHYITDDRIVYLCITDDEFERSRAFAFLSEVRRRFTSTYGSRGHTALPFAMNSEFSRVLEIQMNHFGENKARATTVDAIQNDLDDLNRIMVKNIEQITNRGEKLELLIDKTEDLAESSVTFQKSSRTLARSMFMKNLKLIILLIVIILAVLFFIILMVCGGFSFHKCQR